MVSSLTWLDTPPDNSHHIGGVPRLFIVEYVQFHITGTKVQLQKYEATRKRDKYTSHCNPAAPSPTGYIWKNVILLHTVKDIKGVICH